MKEVAATMSGLPSLLDIYALWKAIPTRWALLGHCFFCASLAPEFRGNFIVCWMATFFGGFAGGPLSALLIMDPARAPINILADNWLGLTWTLVWWLMNYCPYQFVYKVHSWWPVQTLTKVCVSLCRANMMIGRVNLATELYPGVVMAPLVLGTLSGCGGKLTFDFMKHCYGCLDTPHEATVPTYSLRSAFLACSIYYFTSKFAPLSFLTPEEGSALVTTLLVCHSILSDLTGRPMDWSHSVMAFLLKLSNIPEPSAFTRSPGKDGKLPGVQQPQRWKAPSANGHLAAGLGPAVKQVPSNAHSFEDDVIRRSGLSKHDAVGHSGAGRGQQTMNGAMSSKSTVSNSKQHPLQDDMPSKKKR